MNLRECPIASQGRVTSDLVLLKSPTKMNVENLVMMVFLMRHPKKSQILRFTSGKDNTPHIIKQLEEFANPKWSRSSLHGVALKKGSKTPNPLLINFLSCPLPDRMLYCLLSLARFLLKSKIKDEKRNAKWSDFLRVSSFNHQQSQKPNVRFLYLIPVNSRKYKRMVKKFVVSFLVHS